MNVQEPRGYQIFQELERRVLFVPFEQQNLLQRIINLAVWIFEFAVVVYAMPCVIIYVIHFYNSDAIREINFCGINIIFNPYRIT